jgi:hypothetical protein
MDARRRTGSIPIATGFAGFVVLASGSAIALSECAEYWTLGPRWALESGTHFGQLQAKLGHGAAQRIAVHSKLFGRFALVSPVCHQNFAQILSFELTHGFLVADAAGVHLCHQAIQFFSHINLLPVPPDLVGPPGTEKITFNQDTPFFC